MICRLILLVLAPQQLALEPVPAEVGGAVTVHATVGDADVAGQSIEVLLPDGGSRELGRTDAHGELRFEPAVAGEHRFVTTIDGVRVVAPLQVLPARRRWPYAIVGVPLGLAFLVRIWSRGGRRASPGENPAGSAPASAVRR